MGQDREIQELIGCTWDGRYRIEDFVGRGGMGLVFQARQLQTGREVALKIIHRSMSRDETQRARFEREVRNSSQLAHPNSIRLYDYGRTDDGRLYMAMEYLRGETLGDLLHRLGTLPPERASRITRQILKSLAEAHGKGLVHRDLKPENILITEVYGERDFVKVLDFGVAKAVGPGAETKNLTRTGFLCGTPRYVSPEQALGKDLDGRSDLYAVGIVLYQMLAGRPPFVGENPVSIVMKQVHDQPPALPGGERLGAAGKRLAWLAEQMLQKEAKRRPPSAEDVVAFLEGRSDPNELMGRKVQDEAAWGPLPDESAASAPPPLPEEARDQATSAPTASPSEARAAAPAGRATVRRPESAGEAAPDGGRAASARAGGPAGHPSGEAARRTAGAARPEAASASTGGAGYVRRPHVNRALAEGPRDLEGDELTALGGSVPTVDPATLRTGVSGAGAVEPPTRPSSGAHRAPRTRRVTPRSREGDPVWAWVMVGVAIAVLLLSGLVLAWTAFGSQPSASARDAPRGAAGASGGEAAPAAPDGHERGSAGGRAGEARRASGGAEAEPEPAPEPAEEVAAGREAGRALAAIRPPAGRADASSEPVEPRDDEEPAGEADEASGEPGSEAPEPKGEVSPGASASGDAPSADEGAEAAAPAEPEAVEPAKGGPAGGDGDDEEAAGGEPAPSRRADEGAAEPGNAADDGDRAERSSARGGDGERAEGGEAPKPAEGTERKAAEREGGDEETRSDGSEGAGSDGDEATGSDDEVDFEPF